VIKAGASHDHDSFPFSAFRVSALLFAYRLEERLHPLPREGNELSAIFVTMVRNTKAKAGK
jgi:hypothetical protein